MLAITIQACLIFTPMACHDEVFFKSSHPFTCKENGRHAVAEWNDKNPTFAVIGWKCSAVDGNYA